jgi:hypothetical protein
MYVSVANRHRYRGRRTRVYEEARARHPERWSGPVRNWEPIKAVILNQNEARMRQAG